MLIYIHFKYSDKYVRRFNVLLAREVVQSYQQIYPLQNRFFWLAEDTWSSVEGVINYQVVERFQYNSDDLMCHQGSFSGSLLRFSPASSNFYSNCQKIEDSLPETAGKYYLYTSRRIKLNY